MNTYRFVIVLIALGVMATAATNTKGDLNGWKVTPERSSLPMGVYVIGEFVTNFGEGIQIRDDGTFVCEFAGEGHKKG
jgi:hypothetical protein